MSILLGLYPGDQAVFEVTRYLVQITIVILSAWGVARVLRRSGAVAENCVWRWALLLVVAVPVVSLSARRAGLPAVPIEFDLPQLVSDRADETIAQAPSLAIHESEVIDVAPESGVATTGVGFEGVRTATDAGSSEMNAAPSVVNDTSTDWLHLFRSVVVVALGVWILGTAVLGIRLMRGWFGLLQLDRRATPIRARATDDALADVRIQVNLRRPIKLVQTEQISSPMTYGWLRAKIALPRQFADHLSQDQLTEVLLHEAAHIARHDVSVGTLQRVIQMLLWVHPLVWLLGRSLSRTREQVCDNHVLQTRDAADYATTLLQIAQQIGAHEMAVPAVGLFDKRPRLADRVASLMDEGRNKMIRAKKTTVAATVTWSLTVAFTIAGASWSIGQQPDAESDPSAVESKETTRAAPNGSSLAAEFKSTGDKQNSSPSGSSTLASDPSDENPFGAPQAPGKDPFGAEGPNPFANPFANGPGSTEAENPFAAGGPAQTHTNPFTSPVARSPVRSAAALNSPHKELHHWMQNSFGIALVQQPHGEGLFVLPRGRYVHRPKQPALLVGAESWQIKNWNDLRKAMQKICESEPRVVKFFFKDASGAHMFDQVTPDWSHGPLPAQSRTPRRTAKQLPRKQLIEEARTLKMLGVWFSEHDHVLTVTGVLPDGKLGNTGAKVGEQLGSLSTGPPKVPVGGVGSAPVDLSADINSLDDIFDILRVLANRSETEMFSFSMVMFQGDLPPRTVVAGMNKSELEWRITEKHKLATLRLRSGSSAVTAYQVLSAMMAADDDIAVFTKPGHAWAYILFPQEKQGKIQRLVHALKTFEAGPPTNGTRHGDSAQASAPSPADNPFAGGAPADAGGGARGTPAIVDTAEQAYEKTMAAYLRGQTTEEHVYVWSKRWMEGQQLLDRSPKSAQRARQLHHARMVKLLELVRTRANAGVASRLSLDEANYYRHEAELLLQNVSGK